MMERKFYEYEDKVKETIKDELKNHNLKRNVNNRCFASVANDTRIVPVSERLFETRNYEI